MDIRITSNISAPDNLDLAALALYKGNKTFDILDAEQNKGDWIIMSSLREFAHKNETTTVLRYDAGFTWMFLNVLNETRDNEAKLVLIYLTNFTGDHGFNVSINEFTIKTDQPEKSGGEGTAPDPFTYFISSFGTCAGYFVLRFCQSRNIPTENIKISVSNDFNPKLRVAENIKILVELPETYPDKYESALLRTIDQCTVTKTVLNTPNIEVQSYYRQQ